MVDIKNSNKTHFSLKYKHRHVYKYNLFFTCYSVGIKNIIKSVKLTKEVTN